MTYYQVRLATWLCLALLAALVLPDWFEPRSTGRHERAEY